MADKSHDPVALWQNMVGEMEKGFNAFANQAMASPEFSKVVNQVGSVGAGAQKQLGDLMEKSASDRHDELQQDIEELRAAVGLEDIVGADDDES